ncbi:MAG TPA: hypothetical protein VK993_00120 [Chthoniobacterales bacterium]|nr:hypothetical protein [Chthoniobacterales bacterium]
MYGHETVDVADKLFQNAIELGEDLGAANYYRGLIATRNGDVAAAERFLAAATVAEPLIAHYHHSWALRLG